MIKSITDFLSQNPTTVILLALVLLVVVLYVYPNFMNNKEHLDGENSNKCSPFNSSCLFTGWIAIVLCICCSSSLAATAYYVKPER
jgi:hypothetical protein